MDAQPIHFLEGGGWGTYSFAHNDRFQMTLSKLLFFASRRALHDSMSPYEATERQRRNKLVPLELPLLQFELKLLIDFDTFMFVCLFMIYMESRLLSSGCQQKCHVMEPH